MFTDREIAYLNEQDTGRIATVSPSQQPDVAPVGYAFDGQTFTIRGINVEKTLKYRNVARGGDRTAFVVDDYETADTSRPRGVKVHGRATLIGEGDEAAIRLTVDAKWSWGINAPMFQAGRRVIERTRPEDRGE
jgi:pyridoxamine 5'-phosphate oxidase family protein